MALDAMMKIAQAHNIKSLAIPAVGTGVFSCPPDLAAKVTGRVLKKHAAPRTTVEWARLCVVSSELQAVYASALQ